MDHVPQPQGSQSTFGGEVQSLKIPGSQIVGESNVEAQSEASAESFGGAFEQKVAQARISEIDISEHMMMRTNDETSGSEDSGDKTPDTSEDGGMDERRPITETVVVEEDEEVFEEQDNHLVPRYSTFSTLYLQTLLKDFRIQLEVHYEKAELGIPLPIIESLATFEVAFNLKRNPTTSSIWNVLHHEQRIMVYKTEEVGVVYKQKCDCNPGIPHANDIHCPRNIVDESTEETNNDDASTTSEEETAEQIAERKALAQKELEEEMAAKASEARGTMDSMIGLCELKTHIGKLANRLETAKRQGVDVKEERFGTMFIGGPGTGKTTAAKHYAKYLHALGVVATETVKETTAIYLSDGGIDRTQRYINQVEGSGGVLFIDGAHNFMNSNHSRGRKVLDFVLEEIERTKGKVVFLLAGHEEGMRKILGTGSDVAGLLPNVVKFGDMEDDELKGVLWGCLKAKGGERLVVEGGEGGLYMRVAARRVGRGRGASGFGNARAVENACGRIWERQAARLGELRRVKKEKEEAEEKEKKEEEEKEKARKEAEEKEKKDPEVEETTALDSSLMDPETVPKDLEENKERKDSESPIPAPSETLEISSTPEEVKEPILMTETKDLESKDGEVKKNEPTIQDSKDSEVKDVEAKDVEAKDESVEDGKVPEKDSLKDQQKKDEEPTFDPEDYLLTKEDILGPDPGTAALDSPAWVKLQSLTGMAAVKESILSLLSLVQTNYTRELQEKPLLKVSLNRLFLGPPGTGKTLVAKLYAQLLTEIGALSKGEVIIRTPSDLIGKYIGHSEANTKAALTAAMGNVLVIDEAYMMYGSAADKTGSKTDSFRQGIMDTLVGEIQSEPGEDRCVLLLGYEEPMQEMLQNANPGLARRFPISDAFWFQNFTVEELESILKSKLKESILEATEEAIKVGMDVLEKARSRVNFGNGGEVENLISKAKINYQRRISAIPVSERPEQWIFEPQDFDPAFDRIKSAPENLRDLFSDVIGCEDVIEKLGRYQRVCQTLKKRGMDPREFIPTNFVFKGPPGTGKTTTARKVAKIYYDMGFLAEPSVVECSASDLVGKYVGHSGPKTRKVFERGLGKVLFIDEAYRLAAGGGSSCGTGSFNAEVVAELVDLLTKPDFDGKLIVILAGYEKEMNQLLAMNPGLASRFPEEIHFAALDPVKCLEILKMKLEKTGITAKVLDEREGQMFENLVSLLNFLAKTPGWGSARDMETLAKSLSRDVFASWDGEDEELVCSGEDIAGAMDAMMQERRARKSMR